MERCGDWIEWLADRMARTESGRKWVWAGLASLATATGLGFALGAVLWILDGFSWGRWPTGAAAALAFWPTLFVWALDFVRREGS